MATEQVGERIWAASVPIPVSPPAPQAVQTYLIEDRGRQLHVIDPGWESAAGWQAFMDAVHETGHQLNSIASVTITHLHLDHVGLADRIRAETGAIVCIHAEEQRAVHELRAGERAAQMLHAWGVPTDIAGALARTEQDIGVTDLAADVLLEEGDLLPVEGRQVEVLHTPGHTTGHIVLHSARDHLLFAGDLVLESIYPGVGLGARSTSAFEDMIRSLEHVRELPDTRVAPGHGPVFTGLRERADAIASHHRARADEVARIVQSSPELSIWDVAKQMRWARGWENLRESRLLTALSQTSLLVQYAKTIDPAVRGQ